MLLIAAVSAAACFLAGEETDSAAASYVHTVRIEGVSGFYRTLRLFSDTEYGISVAHENRKVPFYPIDDYEIGLLHNGGQKEYSIAYTKGESDSAPDPADEYEGNEKGLTLSVRMLPKTHIMELSHILSGTAGMDLAALVASLSTGRVATREWKRINDNVNPFGGSKHFVSVYTGTILCPRKGIYTFATDSCDGSLIVVNSRPVAEWKGRHRASDSWEHSGMISLDRGFYPFMYVHYNISGRTRAAAAWKRPGDHSFSVLAAENFHAFGRAETVSLSDRRGNDCIVPRINFNEQGVILKGAKKIKAECSVIGPQQKNYVWSAGGKTLSGRSVSVYCNAGSVVEFTLKGFPGRTIRLEAGEPDAYTRIDAGMDIGGVLPLVYTDEEFSVWLRAEKKPVTGDIEYTVAEERTDSSGTVYRSRDHTVMFTDAKDLPISFRGITSLQLIFSPGEVNPGSRAVYTLLYDGIEVDRVEIEFMRDRDPLDNIRAEERNYMTGEHGKERVCVFIAHREKEDAYRKWALLKWLTHSFRGEKPDILFMYEPSGSGDGIEPVFRYMFRDYHMAIHGIDEQPYPLLWLPLNIDNLMPRGRNTAVIVFAGWNEIEHGLPLWYFTRVYDLTVSRIRTKNPESAIIIAGPLPVYGKDALIQEVNKRLASFAVKHHVFFVNTYREMGGEAGWKEYFKRGGGNVLFKSPNEQGLRLIAETIKALLE